MTEFFLRVKIRVKYIVTCYNHEVNDFTEQARYVDFVDTYRHNKFMSLIEQNEMIAKLAVKITREQIVPSQYYDLMVSWECETKSGYSRLW